MTTYKVHAKVDQVVTKKVCLIVEAHSKEEAEILSREALQDYPKATEVVGVVRILPLESQYWIPRSIQLSRVEEAKEIP